MLFIKISVVLAAALGANAKVFLTNSNFDGIASKSAPSLYTYLFILQLHARLDDLLTDKS